MAIPRSEPRVPSPPRFVPHGVFSLQLTAPVAEALQRQPVPLAILALRQAAKLPDLEVTAPESSHRFSLTQRKSQRFLLIARNSRPIRIAPPRTRTNRARNGRLGRARMAGLPDDPLFGVLTEPTASARFRDDRWRRLLNRRSLDRRSLDFGSLSPRSRHRSRTRSKPRIPPPPSIGPCRILTLQLRPPVAEALQREPVSFAILSLRQAAKLPHLEVAPPKRSRPRPLF